MPRFKPIIQWTPALYDRLAKRYDLAARWLFPIGERGRERVVSGMTLGALLDVACGTGTLLEKAVRAGLACFGIDTSWGMLLEVKKKAPEAQVVQASFYALPFAEGVFDYVVETNAVSGAEIDAGPVLREMVRVCAAGGEVRIGDYGKSGRQGFWVRALEKVGILIGDYPHDYEGLFCSLGLEPVRESLGWGGMYQYLQVDKPHG